MGKGPYSFHTDWIAGKSLSSRVNIKHWQVDDFESSSISKQSQFLVVFDGLALERLL